MRRAILPVLLLVGAVVCVYMGLARGAAAASGPVPTAVHLTTPVMSARRLPGALAALVAEGRLAGRLDAAMADPSLAGSQSCVEVDVAGVPVYARDADAALLPASNVKLLTAYAALAKLGSDSRLTTTVVSAGPAAGGVIAGPLFLVGGGDPLLTTADYRPSQTDWTLSSEPVAKLEDLADKIKAAGITRIAGGVAGDDSRFDDQRVIPTWKSTYVSGGQIGPVGALVVNGGFALVGKRKVAVTDPAGAAAASLSNLLTARGVVVGAPPSVAKAPAHAVTVASLDSLTIREIVGEMLRESDNLVAEMLTKELGYRFGGTGTWAAGVATIHDALLAAGLPVAGLTQVDGSGLDRGDRASCRMFGALTGAPGTTVDAIAWALPLAGNCGTLVKRFVGQPAAGRIRAKTGSLIGVAALTGFVAPPPAAPPPACPPAPGPGVPASSRAVTFSLLVNGVASDAVGQAAEDRVAAVVAVYPELPVLDPFGPLP